MNSNRTTFRHDRIHLVALAAGVLTGITPASGQVINEDRQLIPVGAGSGAFFGRSSAIDNGIAIVGADGGENAYTFNAATGAQIALLDPDIPPSRSFGNSVDIKGNIAVVGARWDADNGAESGAAYIFDATTGAQLHKIVPADGAVDYNFGYSISLDGGIVAIGARWDGQNGFRSGAAYLYDASSGALITKILAPDGASSDAFGHSIAIRDGIVAVGAPEDDDVTVNSGSVYLFDTAGVFIRKIIADDPGLADQFGFSVAMDDGVLAVGSNQDNIGNNDNGSAYLVDVATGDELFKLTASDTARQDQFGWSIGIDNGVVVVGSHQDDDLGSLSGSAYLFDASTGTQIAKLLPSDGGPSEYFGSSVAIDNGLVVGGSIHFGPGSAYVFSVPAGCEDLGRFISFKGIDYQQTADNTQPSTQLSFLVDSFIETDPGAITSATLVAGPTNATLFEDPGTGDWESNFDFATKAAMDAAFPSNAGYSMHTLGGDLGTRDQNFSMPPELYPAVPFLPGTGYSDLLAMDPTAEHTVNWAPADGNTTHILVELYAEDLPDQEVFSAELPPSATSLSFPADTMLDGIEYELIVVFFNAPEFFGDDCPGFGAGSVGIVGHASSTAIIFTPTTNQCPADLNGDEAVDFFDISFFLTNQVDWNGDTVFDFFDISAFLAEFSAGCP